MVLDKRTIRFIKTNLAKFLFPLINKWSSNEYTTKDTFHFTSEITNFSNANNYTMASFDIKSLFTNVPLRETIVIILSLAFQNTNKFLNCEKK